MTAENSQQPAVAKSSVEQVLAEELKRLEDDTMQALGEVISLASRACTETARHDAVGQLPVFLLRRITEQTLAALTLMRRNLFGSVAAPIRSIAETGFTLGSIGSETDPAIDRAYVGYELSVAASMRRLYIRGTIEHSVLLPRWERLIPGMADQLSDSDARKALREINDLIEELRLRDIRELYDEQLRARPNMGLPSFTQVAGLSIFRLATLSGLEDFYKTVYWDLSEQAHSRDVIRSAMVDTSDGTGKLAGMLRLDRAALAINTLFPVLKQVMVAGVRIPTLTPVAGEILRTLDTGVFEVERDLPTA